MRTIFILLASLSVGLFQNCDSFKGKNPDNNSSQSSFSQNLFLEGNLESPIDLDVFGLSVPIGPGRSQLRTESAYSGNFGLHLDNVWFTISPPDLPDLEVGSTYQVSFYARRLAIGSRDTGMYIYHYDTSSSNSGLGDSVSLMIGESSDWEYYSASFVAKGPDMYIEFWINEGSGNSVDLDQIEIRKMN